MCVCIGSEEVLNLVVSLNDFSLNYSAIKVIVFELVDLYTLL